MDIDPAVVMDPRIQSMPEPYRWRLFVLWCYLDKGMKLRDADLAPALGISGEELADTKAAIVERGWFDEGWSMLEPPPAPPPPSDQPKASGAERQRKYRERLKGRRNGEVGEGRDVTRDVTRVTAPIVTRDVTQNVTSYAPVTRVTPPPQTPPNKSLTLESLVQTDTHTSSSGVCVTGVTHGPDHDRKKSAPACTEEEVADLMELVSLHFDPLCLSDVWGRHVWAWSVTYPADWIARAIPLIARKAATDKYLGEPWGHAILEKWALAGGPPVAKVYAEPYGPPGESPPGGGASRPPSEFRRRQESLKEFARQKRKEIEDEEAAEEMGRADHDRSRNAAGTRGSRGGVG